MAYIPKGANPLPRRRGLGILDITIPTGPLPQSAGADWFTTQGAADMNNSWTAEQLTLARQGLPVNRGYETSSLLLGLGSQSSSNWLLYAAGALLALALLMPIFSRRK